MCGLFGTIRPLQYPTRARRARGRALADLGCAAQERGQDSAGLAMLQPTAPTPSPRRPVPAVREDTVGRWQLRTALGAFEDHLAFRPGVLGALGSAQIVLGHTRWATQGAVTLDNASPCTVGQVVGTHNGDVDTWPVPEDFGTDSAWLFARLDQARDLAGVTRALTALRGRAALAWARLDQPGHLMLARAALSPLAVAWDLHGGLWWASNPQWLRTVDRHHSLGLSKPEMLREGTVLTLGAARTQVKVVEERMFLPTCRPVDRRLAFYVAWRGFTARDRLRDERQLVHRVSTEAQMPAS